MNKIIKKTKCLRCNSEVNITLGDGYATVGKEPEEFEKDTNILLNKSGQHNISIDDFSTMQVYSKDSLGISIDSDNEYEGIAQIFYYDVLTTTLWNTDILLPGRVFFKDELGRDNIWRFSRIGINTIGDLIKTNGGYKNCSLGIGQSSHWSAYRLMTALSENKLDVKFEFDTSFSQNIYNFHQNLRTNSGFYYNSSDQFL